MESMRLDNFFMIVRRYVCCAFALTECFIVGKQENYIAVPLLNGF